MGTSMKLYICLFICQRYYIYLQTEECRARVCSFNILSVVERTNEATIGRKMVVVLILLVICVTKIVTKDTSTAINSRGKVPNVDRKFPISADSPDT